MGTHRGSRKHVLEWIAHPNFLAEFNCAIDVAGVLVAAGDRWVPNASDLEEAEVVTFGRRVFPAEQWDDFEDWWLKHKRGAKCPTWDLLSTCTVDGQPGLILVEAKAHVRELSGAPKAKPRGAKLPDGNYAAPSANSLANHARIKVAIEEARDGLAQHVPGIAISRDESYQFSNRVAFAWRLAQIGIPSVLLYVGFTGDGGISYVGEPFRDATHWSEVFEEHIDPLFTKKMVGSRISCGNGSFVLKANAMAVRSQTLRLGQLEA